MKTPGERIKEWLEVLAGGWKDRLRGWMASWLMRGMEDLMESMEPEAIDEVSDILGSITEHPATPKQLKDLISKLTAGKHPLPLLILIPIAVLMFIPTITSIVQPLGNLLRYTQENIFHSHRLDPSTITNLWRRDKPAYDKLWDDLKDLGWSDERIDAAKELAKILPPLPDMVRFADFSAFDPEVIEQWRQFYDAPSWITEPMALLGVTNEAPRDWANKYWFSHWIQPGRYELGEIYRRGLLGKPLLGTEEIGGPGGEGEAERMVKLAYRTMGYSSFWQDNLLQLVREVPTRVDVRRWWDMRTIDEEELRSIYQRRGYFGKDLNNYVLWTKVYTAWPDLIARYSKGWITLDDVRKELTGLGMPSARVEEMIQTKVKAQEPGRVEEGKSLTKTEIYKGVKKGVITWDMGVELLMDLGYDEDEADYILTINVEALTGSPESYADFKAITAKFKRATGKEAATMPEELKKAAEDVIRLTKEIADLKRAIKDEEDLLVDDEVLPTVATAKRDELRTTLHRAEAELFRVKSGYDSLVAEWKHGLPS